MKGLCWFLVCLMAVVAKPTMALATDPPTCGLTQKRGTATTHQVLCHGETIALSASCSEGYSGLQWYRQNSAGGWATISGATQTDFTARQGRYKVVFTFGDNSSCETNVDTVSYWKAYQIDWNVAACRAQIASMTPIPFPVQSKGNQEMATPIDLNNNDEIIYNWQVIPEPTQASFTPSSTSIYPLTDGFFQDTTLGLHKVILTVSQQGSSCISVDTMEVTLLPLHVWADTVMMINNYAHPVKCFPLTGNQPFNFSWTNIDSCLTANCDSVLISNFWDPVKVVCTDGSGCKSEFDLPLKFSRWFCASRPSQPSNSSPSEIYCDPTFSDNEILYIPVVFHNVYNDENDFVSDAQIQQQLDFLNEAFLRQNDQTNINPQAVPNLNDIGNPKIQFYLPSFDECGEPFNPIKRRQTPATNFRFRKITSTWSDCPEIKEAEFGSPAINPKRFINIWLARLIGGGVRGFAQFPDENIPIEYDGVVADVRFLGSENNPDWIGRLLTHEMGHYFDLFHPFEFSRYKKCVTNTASEWCDGDGLDDTNPECWGMISLEDIPDDCILFPVCPTATNPYPNVHLFMGVRPYGCRNMFTKQQVNKMRNCFWWSERRTNLYKPLAPPIEPKFIVNNNACNGNIQISILNPSNFNLDPNPQSWPQCGHIAWSHPGGTLSPSSQYGANFTLEYQVSGSYTITATYTNEFGCINTFSKTIYVLAEPISISDISISPGIPFCSGETLVLTAPEILGAIFHWELVYANGNTTTIGNQQIQISLSENQYAGLTTILFHIVVCGDYHLVQIPITIKPTPNPSLSIQNPLCDSNPIQLSSSINPSLGGANYEWRRGSISSGQFSGATIGNTTTGSFSDSYDVLAPLLQQTIAYQVTVNLNGCVGLAMAETTVYNQIFDGAPTLVHYSVNSGTSQPGSQGLLDEINISVCPHDLITFSATYPTIIPGISWVGPINWEGPIGDYEDDGMYVNFSNGTPGLYRLYLQTSNGACLSPKRKINITVTNPGTLTITPYCDETGLYARISGGTPPYSYKRTNQNTFTEITGTDPNDATAALFKYATGSNAIDPGMQGQYLVKDASGGASCSTPFKIWGDNGLIPNLEMTGVNFVQKTLTFSNAFFHTNARIYMYGTGTYNANSPGGTTTGASLVKAGNGAIEIEPNVVISSACGWMWPGIKLENGGAFLADNLTLMDAIFGIEATGEWESFQLQSCTLANNLNGIKLTDALVSNLVLINNQFKSNHQEMKAPFDYQRNKLLSVGGVVLGDLGRFITHRGVHLGVNFIHTGSFSGNLFENCIIGIETGIRPVGIGGTYTVFNSTFTNCTWKGFKGFGYGIGFSGGNFNFPQDISWTKTWQSQNLRGMNFTPEPGPLPVYGIFNWNPDVEVNLGEISGCSLVSNTVENPCFGIYCDKGGNIHNNFFQNLMVGIDQESSSNSGMSIKGNKFTNLGTSVKIRSANGLTFQPTIALDLRCNEFNTDAIPAVQQRIGLLIGSGVTLAGNRIGGDNGITVDGPPNSNYFPRSGSGLNAGPVSGYISIKNESVNPIDYWRYHNELLGNVVPAYSSGSPNYILPQQLSASTFSVNDLNIAAHCAATSNCGLSSFEDCEYEVLNSTTCTGGMKWVKACTGGATDNVAWPVTRMAVSSGTATVTAVQDSELKKESALGQSIPNPGKDRIAIPYYLAEDAGNTALQVLEMATGKVVATLTGLSIGEGRQEVDVSGFASGVFGYRLLTEKGKAPKAMNFVIIR